MMNFIKAVLRLTIGVVSLPLIVSISKSFYSQLGSISILESQNQLYFLYGTGAYLIMHLFFFKPNFLYNLGHEGVHVISTWLSLGKAGNMKVSNQGGSVETSKSNFFISLSPYLVPIYTVLISLAYFGLAKFYDVTAYIPIFIFFIGFTFTMHILMTVEVLRVSQPDLVKTGYLLSLSLIYCLNILLTGFIISLIFTGFSFKDMMMQFCDETRVLYLLIWKQMFGV